MILGESLPLPLSPLPLPLPRHPSLPPTLDPLPLPSHPSPPPITPNLAESLCPLPPSLTTGAITLPLLPLPPPSSLHVVIFIPLSLLHPHSISLSSSLHPPSRYLHLSLSFSFLCSLHYYILHLHLAIYLTFSCVSLSSIFIPSSPSPSLIVCCLWAMSVDHLRCFPSSVSSLLLPPSIYFTPRLSSPTVSAPSLPILQHVNFLFLPYYFVSFTSTYVPSISLYHSVILYSPFPFLLIFSSILYPPLLFTSPSYRLPSYLPHSLTFGSISSYFKRFGFHVFRCI